MTANWFFYALLIGGLMTAAAWQTERALGPTSGRTRWIWGLASMMTILLPLLAFIPRERAVDRLDPDQPTLSLESSPPGERGDRPLNPRLWLGASLLALGWVMLSQATLSRERLSWKRSELLGVSVALSRNFGPAVVGVGRPEIVVPEWITQLPPEQLALILAHEQEHLRRHDSRLLAIMVLLVVAMPWQVFLWLQLKGLKLAIELDCDGQIIRNGAEPRKYGELLIGITTLVAGRSVNRWSLPLTPFSMRLSSLEQRIRALGGSRPSRTIAAIAAVAAIAALTAAFALTPPQIPATASKAEVANSSVPNDTLRRKISKAFPRRSGDFYREVTSVGFVLGVQPLTDFRVYSREGC